MPINAPVGPRKVTKVKPVAGVHSILISIMGHCIEIHYQFFDQAISWWLAIESEHPEFEDSLLLCLLQIHYSQYIATAIRNHRHWQDYDSGHLPDLFPEDLPPHF